MWKVRKLSRTEQSRGKERRECYVECEEAEQRRAEEWKESYIECEEAEESRGEEGVICGM
jgi:hypothetical protein